MSNAIWFPDHYNVAGNALCIAAQSIYTNGSYWLDFYDDQGNYCGCFSGPIDQSGYLSVDGNTQPGFSIDVTDDNGDQLPFDFMDQARQQAGTMFKT